MEDTINEKYRIMICHDVEIILRIIFNFTGQ